MISPRSTIARASSSDVLVLVWLVLRIRGWGPQLRHAEEDQFLIAESGCRKKSAHTLYSARREADFLLALTRCRLLGCFSFVDAACRNLPHLASDTRTVLPYQDDPAIVRNRNQHH
jgi:hypothetical protein